MSDDLDRPFLDTSRYAIPREQALDEIQKRKADLLNSAAPVPPPEPDLAVREDIPILGDSQKYAAEFWDRMVQKEPPVDPPKLPAAPRRGRRPKGKSLTEKHTARFRVIDGADKDKT